MKITRLVVVLAALLSLTAAGAGTASATTVDDCQTKLGTLRQATLAAPSFVNAKSVESLAAKLEDASAKLAAGKNADAVAKLVDFQATLSTLATARTPKVDPAVAAALSGDAQAVIACIEGIGTA